MSSLDDDEIEDIEFNRLKQGTYADVLFVMLPFLAISMQRIWSGEVKQILLGYELSTAAATLAGLSISKFIQGLVAHPLLGVNKERVIFLISLTLFLVVIPSIIMTMKLVGTEKAPEVVVYVQPILLILSISLYVNAIRMVKNFEETEKQDNQQEVSDEEAAFTMNSLLESDQKKDSDIKE